MAEQKSRKNQVKVYFLTILFAVVSSYGFGLLANLIGNNDLRCVAIGAIGGCDPNNPFLYIFGFYYALIFCMTFSQIVFIRKSSPAYFFIITPLLAIGLLELGIFEIAIIFIAAAILSGFVIGKIFKQY